MKRYQVRIVSDAEHDIFEICQYLMSAVSRAKAEQVFTQLEEASKRLANMPERGHFPPELERLGIHEYREIHSGVYRMIYEISGDDVLIHAVLDSRRDLHDLLFHRLLRDEVA